MSELTHKCWNCGEMQTVTLVEGEKSKAKLEQEAKELKALQEKYVWITREELKQHSDIDQALMGKSLAQHDKETLQKAKKRLFPHEGIVSSPMCSLEAFEDYIEQLQEQGNE